VTALASGAILLNYQRLRIEHVCQRLGLVSISYLWQASQLPLLEKMLAGGMEVILVKVAGVGLGIDLVGKNLREVMPLLRRLVSSHLFPGKARTDGRNHAMDPTQQVKEVNMKL
jgi:diphthine-ammonia ligase